MNQLHPKKLLDSKWTAVHPKNSEKHFVVTRCTYSSPGVVDLVELEAVYTGQCYEMPWRDLKDDTRWLIGWK
ncbi:MAG: TIGR02450 family Trp-rich protein [Chloroflexota bacterium]